MEVDGLEMDAMALEDLMSKLPTLRTWASSSRQKKKHRDKCRPSPFQWMVLALNFGFLDMVSSFGDTLNII